MQGITINGEERQVPVGISVDELLDHLRVDRRHVAVERNRQIVKKPDFAATPVRPGDRFEIVTFVGGG